MIEFFLSKLQKVTFWVGGGYCNIFSVKCQVFVVSLNI